MEIRNSEGNLPFFVWPDVSVFPNRSSIDLYWRRVERVMFRFVTPAVSFFGIMGNIINIVILVRGKLNKSSTLLILALAVADTIYLLGTNNIALQLYSRDDQFGFDYPEEMSRFLFYMYMLQMSLDLIGKVSSMSFPWIITLDRLVAVWAPLRYHSIMTANRVRVTIFTTFFFSATVFLFYSIKYSFLFSPLSSINVTSLGWESDDNDSCVGLIAKSEFYKKYFDIYQTVVKTAVFIYGPVPLTLTVIGCIVVGIRINMTEKSRKSLLADLSITERERFCVKISGCIRRVLHKDHTANARNPRITSQAVPAAIQKRVIENSVSTRGRTCITSDSETGAFSVMDGVLTPVSIISAEERVRNFGMNAVTASMKFAKKSKMRKGKTTRTLLSVCCLYCIANTINFLVLFYFNENKSSPNLAIAMETSRKFVLVLNSAFNFLFYVGLNRNFRDSYRKLFALCLPCLRK